MIPHVTVGSGCFHYWFLKLPSTRSLDRIFQTHFRTPHSVDGIEIFASFADLSRWMHEPAAHTLPGDFGKLSPSTQQMIGALPGNSVHLPPLSSLSHQQIQNLSVFINTISSTMNIEEFTIHPDRAKSHHWEALLSAVDSHIRISIENMDIRKADYRTLDECAELLDHFPTSHMTFDICHWIENGEALDSIAVINFFREYGDRVSKIHFSVPWMTEPYLVHSEIETQHYLVSSSDQRKKISAFLSSINPSLIVVEGVVPAGSFAELERDVLYLRSLREVRSLAFVEGQN